MGLRKPLIPAVLDERPDQLKERGRWRQFTQQRRKLAFQFVPANGLAAFRASPVEAHVVRVLHARLALGP